jgi:hypothetical protein
MLTKQPLADAYARAYARELERVTGESVTGKVWARDLGSGWIELVGNSLPPPPELKHQYPNGWTLIDRKRYGYVRRYIAQQRKD